MALIWSRVQPSSPQASSSAAQKSYGGGSSSTIKPIRRGQKQADSQTGRQADRQKHGQIDRNIDR